MSRRPEAGTLVLGLLGGLLLVYLTLPLAYLFFQIDWGELNTSPIRGRFVPSRCR